MDVPPVTPSTARRLLARVATAQADGRVPSLVAVVVRDGSPVWRGGYGDVPGPVDDTHYRIGSITKTLTAVLVLQLVHEGRIGLDTAIGSVLGLPRGSYGDRTVADLLAHNGGLPAEPNGEWWERTAGSTFDELVATNPGDGVWPAGRRFHYTNLGFALLGELAARVLGRPWWEAVRDRILDPLGMTRTSYLPEAPAARGWSVDPYAGALVAEPATDTGAMAPAGQAWSTLGDLARWSAFLVAGDPAVLPVEQLEQALTPSSGEPEAGLGYAHALGFQLLPGGSGTLVGHLGSMPGFLAGCFVDRPRRTGAAILANGTVGVLPSTLIADLLDELERCEPTLPPPWTPSDPVRPEAGDVLGLWHWGNTPMTFTWEGSSLVQRRGGVVQGRFAVVEGRVLGVSGYHAGEHLEVVRRPDGSVSHLDLATYVLTRVPYDPAAPIPGGPPDPGWSGS